jgi:hypothetical protein
VVRRWPDGGQTARSQERVRPAVAEPDHPGLGSPRPGELQRCRRCRCGARGGPPLRERRRHGCWAVREWPAGPGRPREDARRLVNAAARGRVARIGVCHFARQCQNLAAGQPPRPPRSVRHGSWLATPPDLVRAAAVYAWLESPDVVAAADVLAAAGVLALAAGRGGHLAEITGIRASKLCIGSLAETTSSSCSARGPRRVADTGRASPDPSGSNGSTSGLDSADEGGVKSFQVPGARGGLQSHMGSPAEGQPPGLWVVAMFAT